MMRLYVVPWLVLLSALAVAPVRAQAPAPADPCPTGAASGTLEGRNVRAVLYTTGSVGFGLGTTNGDGYLAPLRGGDAGRSPLYASGLWVGGRVGGEIRTAASRYTTFAFRPGRAGADGVAPTPGECASADRLWTVARSDLDAYARDGTLTDDLRDWPLHLGAPVLDGDGIDGNYDLASGDQPAIRGDVTTFWAMNDLAAARSAPDHLPLGVDVTAEAFAFRSAPFVRSDTSPLAAATAYRYTITNRSGATMTDVHVGFFFDTDLGNPTDDYMGVDTTLQMAYTYNADDIDEGTNGYGDAPPAFGIVIVESPSAPDGTPRGLTASAYIVSSGPVNNDPVVPEEYFHRLLGLWNDGSRMRAYGNALPGNPGPVTTFTYTGDPVTGAFWSERDTDGQGTANPPGDLRFLVASGPTTLAPGASTTFGLAFVFAQGDDHLDSVTRLRANAATVRALHAAGIFEPSRVGGPSQPPAPPVSAAIRRPAPNPFAEATTLTLDGLAGQTLTVRVLDVLGRTVEEQTVVPAGDGERVALGASLSAGVYVMRVEGRGFGVTLPVVKTR